MPKIIENLPARLIEEAGRQIQEVGYSALTIRSVAKACGVGVGTVYNYYASKDELVAAFMLEGWKDCLEQILAVAETSETVEPVLRCIHGQLCAYAYAHQTVTRDAGAAVGFAASMGKYHTLLRSQLAQPLQRWIKDPFTGEFIAEALLTWTMEGKDFSEVYRVLQNLCEEK